MIVVRLAGEQIFDVAETEAELFDTGADQGNTFFVVAVEQDTAFRRNEEVRSQKIGADVVDVAGDSIRINGFVPGKIHAILLREQREEKQRGQEDPWQPVSHSLARTFAPSAPPSIGRAVRITKNMSSITAIAWANEAGS